MRDRKRFRQPKTAIPDPHPLPAPPENPRSITPKWVKDFNRNPYGNSFQNIHCLTFHVNLCTIFEDYFSIFRRTRTRRDKRRRVGSGRRKRSRTERRRLWELLFAYEKWCFKWWLKWYCKIEAGFRWCENEYICVEFFFAEVYSRLGDDQGKNRQRDDWGFKI